MLAVTHNTDIIIIAPRISKCSDSAYVSGEFDPETRGFHYTMCAVIGLDDVIYYCELPKRNSLPHSKQ